MRLSLAMYECEGVVDFDDVSVEPVIAGALPEGEA